MKANERHQQKIAKALQIREFLQSQTAPVRIKDIANHIQMTTRQTSYLIELMLKKEKASMLGDYREDYRNFKQGLVGVWRMDAESSRLPPYPNAIRVIKVRKGMKQEDISNPHEVLRWKKKPQQTYYSAVHYERLFITYLNMLRFYEPTRKKFSRHPEWKLWDDTDINN